MTTGARPLSDFCFLNLMTPDGEAAKAFFAKVLGWTYGAMPGVPGGTLVLVDGKTAGAIMDLDKSQMPPGTPPVIGVMIRVEDADRTVAMVRELGGKADAPMNALENGRMALCSDPNGGMFGIWQAMKEVGFECDSHAEGAPTWFETHTSDPDKAVPFYTKLFGWRATAQDMGTMVYTVFHLGDRPIAGGMKRMAESVPSHWGTYFAVKNCDDTVTRAKAAGAEVCMPPTDIPNVGRFALLRSPQGVMFHVLTYTV